MVLDVAMRLEKLLLAQQGVEVVLTRRTNSYVSLEDRTEIANRSNADLFLSIHVNASASANARGIETYFLNFASNAAAEVVAARENAGSREQWNLPTSCGPSPSTTRSTNPETLPRWFKRCCMTGCAK
jgi:N-acetylmuramoyl-L-alanine amidase